MTTTNIAQSSALKKDGIDGHSQTQSKESIKNPFGDANENSLNSSGPGLTVQWLNLITATSALSALHYRVRN